MIRYLTLETQIFKLKVVISRTNGREKIWFFRPPEMTYIFQTIMIRIKGLEMDAYKPPKRVRSYHTHGANSCWLLLKKQRKNTNFTPIFEVFFGHFFQQKSTVVNRMCMIWPHTFWGLVNIHLKSFYPKYHGLKKMSHLGGSKKPYFCPCTRFLK